MDLACKVCRFVPLQEGPYRHRIFSAKDSVFHLYRYFILHLVQLVVHIVLIKERLLQEALNSIIGYHAKTVVYDFDYPAVGTCNSLSGFGVYYETRKRITSIYHLNLLLSTSSYLGGNSGASSLIISE